MNPVNQMANLMTMATPTSCASLWTRVRHAAIPATKKVAGEVHPGGLA